MSETSQKQGVIRRDKVRVLGAPALVEGGAHAQHAGASISVVPLLDGTTIAGFEIRCSCGTSAVVECVYTQEAQS
ncbi:MAG: hypothetical protein U1E73_00505 [Planctomycetota bacterium]